MEAGLWIVMGAIVAVLALRKAKRRGTLLTTAIILIAFGVSDLVETRTGARWKPWWLLVWKVGCIALILFLIGFILVSRRSPRA